MEPEEHGKAGWSWAVIAVVIIVALGLVGISQPVILRSKKAPDRTQTINNIKQVGAMLLEFDADYGKFPDDETALEVKRRTNTDFTLTGPYSNDYFRQMLPGGGGKSERPFWCKTAQSPKKADDDFRTPSKALAAGEVGFSYIMESPTKGQSASGEPSRPVVVTPSYQFQADWTFDPEVYSGKAVVLRLDNSATAMQIREDNKKVSTNSGKTLGDTGDQTPWGTDITPFMRAPQPRPEGK